MKASAQIVLKKDGTIQLIKDDAFHSNRNFVVSGGTYTMSSGDDRDSCRWERYYFWMER